MTPERQQEIGLLQQLVATHKRGDFRTITAPLVERGFQVLPVVFKQPAIKNWPTMSQTLRLKLGNEKPWLNAAVWSKHGVGNLMFLDVDAIGVIKRIESGIGRRIPRTYTVETRPNSEHKHFYFYQTPYSVKAFNTTVNVRDLENADGSHPTAYDLKGCGGASYVVAPGSIRENGDLYTVVNDAPVQNIPDEIVDWLEADIREYRAGKEAERQRNLAAVKDKIAAVQRGVPLGFSIFESDTSSYLRRMSGTLASLGLDADGREKALIRLALTHCENGKLYVDSEDGLERIHRIAHDPKLKLGNAVLFYAATNSNHWRRRVGRFTAPPPSRQGAIVELMRTFPSEIAASDAYTQLEEGIPNFCRKNKAHRRAAQLAFRTTGFVSKRLGAGKVLWTRQTKSMPPNDGATEVALNRGGETVGSTYVRRSLGDTAGFHPIGQEQEHTTHY
jgi:hypothetical protein